MGSGPFVTELDNAVGERIRVAGNEFGTTTGRPRRCGWFDAVSCRYTARRAGATGLALMHLDTLGGFDEIGICVGYKCDGNTLQTVPANAAKLASIEPVIEMVPGWSEDLRSIRRFEDLPDTARQYVERIETLVGVPVTIAGVGPDREQTLIRGEAQQITLAPQTSGAADAS